MWPIIKSAKCTLVNPLESTFVAYSMHREIYGVKLHSFAQQ